MLRRTPLGGVTAITVLALSWSLAMPSVADAQSPPPTPPHAGGPVPPAAAAAGQVPGADATSPPTIVINDPMLTAVPPAPHVLGNWKDALGLIVSRSTSLATAMQEIQRAEGNARIALAAALPTITATGSVVGQILYSSTAPVMGVPVATGIVNPTVTAQITASVPILSPRAWYGIHTGEMGVTSAKLSVEDQKRTIFAGVASSIISVFTAERTVETNRVGLRSALSIVDLTRRQFRLGSATQLDVLRVEQNAATARATLVSGDEALRQAREALGIALGFNEAYGVPSSLSLSEIETTLRGICAESPLDQRADIKKAHNDIEVAKRGITDAWLAFSPFATLSTTAAVSNQTSSISGGNGTWSVTGLLTIPIWEGGARYGTLRIAKAQAEEVKIALEASLRTANVQIAQALRSVAVAEQERGVSASARDLAKELARLTQSSYRLGTATSFDLVNTEQTWRASELDLIVKEFAVTQAKLTAVLATSNCNY